jgi:two-component system, chemotaxis family, CheB/CheR fusion protein
MILATLSSSVDFLIVGISTSAGGLADFDSFFSGMPVDTDPQMAFSLGAATDPGPLQR